MILLAIMVAIIFAVVAGAIGSAKGYDGFLCACAGLFGGELALIIIGILPDQS